MEVFGYTEMRRGRQGRGDPPTFGKSILQDLCLISVSDISIRHNIKLLSAKAIMSEATTQASSSKAPYRHFPKQSYWSIEYPGPVSHPAAILDLIPQEDIDGCFNAPASEQRVMELSFERDSGRGVPIRGTRVGCQKLLVKVVKRRRKRRSEDGDEQDGVFTADVVGPITQTARFRGEHHCALLI